MYIYPSIAFIFLTAFAAVTKAQDANNNVFQVTAPKTGDTITSLGSTLNGVEVPIEWTVPSALADRPVMITLVQGTNLSSLSRIEQINSSVPNTGSYTWRGDTYNSALVYAYGYGAPSGCNYSIELKVWTYAVYSGYFTIINPDDGGLSTTAQCPEGDGTVGPSERTYTSDGQSEVSGSEETSSGTSTATGSSSSKTSSPSGASGESNSGNSNNGSNGGGGVSTTTLAVAVAVPVVVLVLAFGLIIWLGIRKGWFVKKSQSPRDDSVAEKNLGQAHNGGGDKPVGGEGEVRELHSNHMPYQLEFSPVHELAGKENDVGRN